jgi:uncharacterized membrane protein YkoI
MAKRRYDEVMIAAARPLRNACAALAFAAAGAQAGPAERQCFSTAQSRDEIAAHRLADSLIAMRAATRDASGEALSARLCRVEETLVYEISVLRTDGRIVRHVLDAASGKPYSGRKDH